MPGVSEQAVTTITDRVIEAMSERQNRPLDPVYPVVFIDAINVKIREGNVADRPGHQRSDRDCGSAQLILQCFGERLNERLGCVVHRLVGAWHHRRDRRREQQLAGVAAHHVRQDQLGQVHR